MTREVREALERLRPRFGAKATALWAAYLSADRLERQSLEQQIRLLDLKFNETGPSAGPPPLPPPEPGVLDGWLRLGEVTYPGQATSPFGLERGELIQHVGIFGRSGAGKTNTVMVLLRELLSRGVPFLIFDWKRNYRDLLAAPWVPKGRVAALTPGRDLAPLRLNPLRPPPGTGPRTWLKKLIEIIAHAYFLGEGVMYLLQEAIDACYRKAGVYDGAEIYPTFHDVHRHLKTRKVTGREANWMASTLRTLGALTFGPMADTVCCDDGADVSMLLKGNVILELDALTDTDKVFLVEALLLQIHHLRLAEPGREKLKHVILVEEAHHVFLKAKQELAGGEPLTDVILREIRELGEAIVLVDQHPSQIAITALGNTYCTVAMNLKHRADVGTISDACLLEPDQRDHLGRLPVGHAVVKLQDRWASPFMVQFPLLPLEKGVVTDEMICSWTAPSGKSERFSEVRPVQALSQEVPAIPEPPKQTARDADIPRFLEDMSSHPESGVTDRYRRLGLSRRKGTHLKRLLITDGLAREIHVPLPGGRVTLLEPTADGLTSIGKSRPDPRSGGVIHRFWMSRVSRALSARGMEVEFEIPAGNGQAIDIMGTGESGRTAIEIEVSGRRLKDSIEKLARTNAFRRVVACASSGMVDRARKAVEEMDSISSVEIEVVHVWALIATREKETEKRKENDI